MKFSKDMNVTEWRKHQLKRLIGEAQETIETEEAKTSDQRNQPKLDWYRNQHLPELQDELKKLS